MRVAQICTNAMLGSVGSIVRNICSGLKENGDEYLICYGRGKEPEGYNHYKIDNTFEVYYHAFLARIFDSDGLHSKNATKRLIKKLKDFKPDVVHIHCLHGYYINYPMLFEYFSKDNIKVVWTMHDCWAFTGHCCNFEYTNCNKWKEGCGKCKQIKSYPKSYIDNTICNFNKKKKTYEILGDCIIVTPSNWLGNLIKNSFLNKHEVVVIPNGIDTSVFKPTYDEEVLQKYKIKSDKRVILCVASIWNEKKGLEDIIELSTLLSDEFQLVVVGLTDKQIKSMPFNITSIPRTENVKELCVLYTSAYAFFNPTYEDNYPTVNLEAICCGTPVITYKTGGSPECLSNHKYGYDIEKKDYLKLIELIQKINLKKNVLDISSFSKSKMIENYIELYRGVKM